MSSHCRWYELCNLRVNRATPIDIFLSIKFKNLSFTGKINQIGLIPSVIARILE